MHFVGRILVTGHFGDVSDLCWIELFCWLWIMQN